MDICENCGKEYNKKMKTQRFCSKECKIYYNNHFRNLVKCTCHQCDKEFERNESLVRSDILFCSSECQHQYYSDKGTEIRVCEYCGEKFKVIKSKDWKCCSKSCEANRRSELVKHKRITKCDNCGNEIIRKNSYNVQHYQMHFCCKKCEAEFYRKTGMFSGENNLQWKGGDVGYYGTNWYGQRDLARERDDYTCQDCGITEEEYGKQLSVHHLKLFRSFNGDWESANRLENLICICEPCHRKRHSNQYKYEE